MSVCLKTPAGKWAFSCIIQQKYKKYKKYVLLDETSLSLACSSMQYFFPLKSHLNLSLGFKVRIWLGHPITSHSSWIYMYAYDHNCVKRSTFTTPSRLWQDLSLSLMFLDSKAVFPCTSPKWVRFVSISLIVDECTFTCRSCDYFCEFLETFR